MCANDHSRLSKKYRSVFFYMLAISLGILSGWSDIVVLQQVGTLISDIFIRLFKFISLPIIALSLIVTLSQYRAADGMQKVWRRTLLYTVSTTLVAATIAFVLYLLIKPTNIATIEHAVSHVSSIETSYFTYLLTLIPTNIFAPFLEHQVMGVLCLSIALGIAIRYIPEMEAQQAISNFFKGAHGVFLVMTSWIVKMIPLGLFGFITVTVLEMKKGSDLRGLGEYLAVIVLANLVQGFVILPLWLYINKVRPFAAMYGILPALSVAFFSKSSAGTLPVTMETAERNLNVSPKISRFVLPLCTTINMNGCAAFIFVTVIYLMQNHGMDVGIFTMASWIVIATIAAVGNAGVPMGCFFLSASLLTSMNVPIVILGLILPFYSLIDMIETALNVWSDVCVTKVVDSKTV